MIICKSKEKECCDNPNIIMDFRSNIYTCKNCGTTFEDISIVPQTRIAYSKEERDDRLHYEPYNRNFGASTYLDSRFDVRGKRLNPRQQYLFNRLNRINKSAFESVERNYMIATPILRRILKQLNLGNVIYETAWKVYKDAVDKRLTLGRSIEDLCYASVYVATRIHGITISIDEILENIDSKGRSIHKTIKIVMQRVVQEEGIKITPNKMREVIDRLCNKVNTSAEIQSKACNILKKAIKNGFNYQGRSRFGIASAVIYIASQGTYPPLTQKELAIAANTTEVTLRNNLKLIQKYLKKDTKNPMN